MKTIWIFCLINFLALVLYVGYDLTKKEKIVYVDAQKLMSGYKGMQDARQEYEGKVVIWRANLDTLRLEMENKVKTYEASKNKLNARERQLMEEVLNGKHEQYMQYQQVINEKIQSADEELTTKVLGKVNDFIHRYGKRKGYSMVMAATQYGNIVYTDESKDITVEVLNGLNEDYGK